MGVRAAARAFDLEFVPVTHEPYDLVLDEGMRESDLLAPSWRLLETASFVPQSNGWAAMTPPRWGDASADAADGPCILGRNGASLFLTTGLGD